MQRKDRKTYKNLMVVCACMLWVFALSAAHAATSAGEEMSDSSRQFIPLDRAGQGVPNFRGGGKFMSLKGVRRGTSTRKAIALHGKRPGGVKVVKLKDLKDTPRIAKREDDIDVVKLAKVQAAWPIVEHADEAALLPKVNVTPSVPGQGKSEDMEGYVWPVEKGHTKISSGYGPRTHPVTGRPDFHAGIDIPAPRGTPVVAAASGEVTGAGIHPRLGRYIKITHDDGTYSQYGHLHRWTTRMGRAVKAGERIGTVGSSGRSTGPHLDFSIRKDGKPIDPMDVLDNNTLAFAN